MPPVPRLRAGVEWIGVDLLIRCLKARDCREVTTVLRDEIRQDSILEIVRVHLKFSTWSGDIAIGSLCCAGVEVIGVANCNETRVHELHHSFLVMNFDKPRALQSFGSV